MCGMDRHTWTLMAGGHELVVERLPDGGILTSWGGKPIGTIGATESVLGREILRLAERVTELEGVVAMRDGTLAMAVARLGGEVEGAPTHRGNFLQRIDQLVAKERELEAAEITAEEGQEIIAELTAALAVLNGESLTPCAGGCPGHLGEKASAAAREALDRWTALEAENARLRHAERRFTEERVAGLRREVDAARGADPFRGFVVWHRQDGECVRLYPVNDDEERTMASIFFKTDGEAQVIVWRQDHPVTPG